MNRKLRTDEIQRLTIDEFRRATKIPLFVVLDNIRSRHNVGSIFRTADAFCAEGLLLCGCTATPPHADIHKTALGAEDAVDWTYWADTHQAIEHLRQRHCTIYAIEQCQGSITLQYPGCPLNPQNPTTPIAIVLGNEVKGVQQSVIDRCDGCIEIPQYGTKHSLNVSVAAGIIIYIISSLLGPNKNNQ